MQISLPGRKRPRNWEMNVLPLPREDWWSRPTKSPGARFVLKWWRLLSLRRATLRSIGEERKLSARSNGNFATTTKLPRPCRDVALVSSTPTKLTRGRSSSFVVKYFSIRRKREVSIRATGLRLFAKTDCASLRIFINIYIYKSKKYAVMLNHYYLEQICISKDFVFKHFFCSKNLYTVRSWFVWLDHL